MKEEKIYQTNKKNQITQAGNLSISWDQNGNMTSKSNGYNFKYDFQNRLREATNPGGLQLNFVYDNFNRRIMKKMSNVQSQMSNIYIYDDDETIEEYQLSNSPTLKLSKQYVYGSEIDKKIMATVDLDGNGQLETEYYFLQDQLANVEALLDNQGRKIEEYEYSGYGNVTYYQPDNVKPFIEQLRIDDIGNLVLLFNEPVMAETINAENIQLRDSNNQPVNGNWTIDEEKRQITFDTSLTAGQNYNLIVQNIYDLNSNKIDSYSKTFIAQANSIIDDTKAPEIETVYQEAGNLIVKFTEDLKPESINANSIILKRNNNLVEGTTEVLNGRTLKFIPSNSLIENLIYELSIDQSARDLSDKQISQTAITFTYVRDNIQVVFYAKPDQRQEISTTAYTNFHLFQGREFDKELDLYYFRNRYLDPELKIWITKDPEEYADAYNLYQAFGLDQINIRDPYGKEAWKHKNKWDIKFQNLYSKESRILMAKYYGEEAKFYCEDFPLQILIDFAAEHNLPISIENPSGIFNSFDDKFKNKKDFEKAVQESTAAGHLYNENFANTISVSWQEAKPGDILLFKFEFGSHTQIIHTIKGTPYNNDFIAYIYQGNVNEQAYLWQSKKAVIQRAVYKNNNYYRLYPPYAISDQFDILRYLFENKPRRWNFKKFNNNHKSYSK